MSMTREQEIEGKDWKRRVWKLCLGEKKRKLRRGRGRQVFVREISEVNQKCR